VLGAEVHQDGVVVDAQDDAEAVFVVGDLIGDGERLGRGRRSRGGERAAGQVAPGRGARCLHGTIMRLPWTGGVMKLSRLAGWAGIAGPLLFTAAWVAGSLRQAGHPAAGVQLSGLAAEDARDPQIMMAAFVVLGACTIGFGAALRRVAALGSAGPWLVMVAGAAAVAAGVFRRDHMLLTGPGFVGESWHNQVHDVASGVVYVAMLAAPLVLARRFRADPDWAVAARPVLVLALASAATMAVFASQAAQPWNGVLQRAAVTLALTAEAVIATRLLTLRNVSACQSVGDSCPFGCPVAL